MPQRKPDGRRLNGKGSKWITRERRLAIYLRDGFACAYCGRALHRAQPWEVTLDHIKPKVDGGTNASGNLITACASCNSRRQDKPLREVVSPSDLALIRRNVRRALPVALAKALVAGRVSKGRALREVTRG